MLENHMVLNTPDAPWNAPDDDGSERLETLINFMDDLEGWRRNGPMRASRTGILTQVQYVKGPCDYQIIVNLSGWEYNGFTDGDIDGVATGRWKQIDDGETVDELKRALAAEAERLEEMAEERRELAAEYRLKDIEHAANDLIWALDRGYFGKSDIGDSAFIGALRQAVA